MHFARNFKKFRIFQILIFENIWEIPIKKKSSNSEQNSKKKSKFSMNFAKNTEIFH